MNGSDFTSTSLFSNCPFPSKVRLKYMYPIGPFVIYASVNVIVGIEPVSLFHMELAARLSMVKSFGRGDEPSTSKSAYRMYF